MSPDFVVPTSSVANVLWMNSTGLLSSSNGGAVRPAVSLKAGTRVSSGDGTVGTPYVIE